MYRNIFLAFIPLTILIVIPLVLRPVVSGQAKDSLSKTDKLVIISPHSESTRYEFTKAFQQYYLDRYHRQVRLEWRSPGGTSDIVKYIADRYETAFKQYWRNLFDQVPWNSAISAHFTNSAAVHGSKFPVESIKARTVFLESNISIGIDLFFGGGQYDHHRQAERGYSVDAGLQRLHPEWFNEQIIPLQFGGETLYDKNGRYYGVCLSTFGICWNYSRLAEMHDSKSPETWSDLSEPRFFNKIAIADPSKSGSINKCFEMIIQQQFHLALTEEQNKPHDQHKFKSAQNAYREQGWANGINLIKLITANSRYITDSASKVPHDVASGNAVAGICIDFYGRSEAEWSAMQNDGNARMGFTAPLNGTSLSADPIQLLRGAPNRKTAISFIEFLLSESGQQIWNFKVGTSGGPVKYALRRLPIRKDMYQPRYTQFMSDSNFNPYLQLAGFDYNYNYTGRYFNLIRVLIKCIALDPVNELQDAWQAIIKAGGVSKVPQAMAAFNRIPFNYRDIEEAQTSIRLNNDFNSMSKILKKQREWSEQARDNYRTAKQLAEAGL